MPTTKRYPKSMQSTKLIHTHLVNLDPKYLLFTEPNTTATNATLIFIGINSAKLYGVLYQIFVGDVCFVLSKFL